MPILGALVILGVPYRTVCTTPPWADFPCQKISTAGIVQKCQQRSALETSRRGLSEDVSFSAGTLFGCRAIERRKTLLGCVIHTVVYGMFLGTPTKHTLSLVVVHCTIHTLVLKFRANGPENDRALLPGLKLVPTPLNSEFK